MWSLIGGSGFEELENVIREEFLPTETPFGEASPGFAKLRMGHQSFLFIPRHGDQHQFPPSEVNYLANLYALKEQGASKVLAFSAVGSLREDLKPGEVVVPSQFIDRTKRRVDTSFTGTGLVGHVSLADPIWQSGKSCLEEEAPFIDARLHFDKTLVCIEGPHYSTRAESQWYRSMGADVINMTSFPEYALAKELGLCYLPVGFITDYDCWRPDLPAVTVQEVMSHSEENQKVASQILRRLFETDPPVDEEWLQGNLQASLMTDAEAIQEADQRWLKSLFQ